MVGPAVAAARVTRASSDHQQNTIGASAYARKWRHGRFRIANVPRTLSAVLTLAEEMATQGAASSAISGTADAGSTPASDGARTGRQRDGHAAARMTTPQRQASGRCSGVPTSMTALQMLSQRCCTGMLSLGCPVLDQCVGGGLPVRGITEVSMPRLCSARVSALTWVGAWTDCGGFGSWEDPAMHAAAACSTCCPARDCGTVQCTP